MSLLVLGVLFLRRRPYKQRVATSEPSPRDPMGDTLEPPLEETTPSTSPQSKHLNQASVPVRPELYGSPEFQPESAAITHHHSRVSSPKNCLHLSRDLEGMNAMRHTRCRLKLWWSPSMDVTASHVASTDNTENQYRRTTRASNSEFYAETISFPFLLHDWGYWILEATTRPKHNTTAINEQTLDGDSEFTGRKGDVKPFL